VHSFPSLDTSPQVLSLSITGCNFSNSQASFDTTFFTSQVFAPFCLGYIGGGAAFVRKFSASIAGSSFTDNSAITSPFFGAYYGVSFNPAFANGGGLLLRGSAIASDNDFLTATVTNCNFTRNTASGAGFAIFLEPGSTLGVSLSSLSYNNGVSGTITSQGITTITSSLFSFNTALYIANDLFVTCMSAACSANVATTTFSTPDGYVYHNQKLQDAVKAGFVPATLGDNAIPFKMQVCQISSVVITGNGPNAPFIEILDNSNFIDLRDEKGFCSQIGVFSLSVAFFDVSVVSTGANQNCRCSSGRYPSFTSGISAVLSLVALSSVETILYQYPSFKSQSQVVPILKYQLFCLPCPPNTFQGINPLSLSDYSKANLTETTPFFCKPCPAGGNCTNTSVLNVLPGSFLWNTSNANNANVSVFSRRMPPGYGARLVFILLQPHYQRIAFTHSLCRSLARITLRILSQLRSARSPTLPPGSFPVALAAIAQVRALFVCFAAVSARHCAMTRQLRSSLRQVRIWVRDLELFKTARRLLCFLYLLPQILCRAIHHQLRPQLAMQRRPLVFCRCHNYQPCNQPLLSCLIFKARRVIFRWCSASAFLVLSIM